MDLKIELSFKFWHVLGFCSYQIAPLSPKVAAELRAKSGTLQRAKGPAVVSVASSPLMTCREV
jgi:hypothetical protein